MKYKELTKENLEYITSVYTDKNRKWDDRMTDLVNYTGTSNRNLRKWLAKLKISKGVEDGLGESEQYEEAKKKKHGKSKYFLVTWAQNNTPIHNEMLSNMESYANFLGGEILVIAGRYRNPTSLQSNAHLKHKEKSKEITWGDKVISYLTANRHNIHKYLMLLGDVKTQPTANTPLTGFESFSALESTILGHPRQHFKSLPILDGYPHKTLFSTGAVTKQNYTDTKAGKKGDFHHVFGFIVVEIKDNDTFYARNVSVDDSGEFNDLYFNVKQGKVSKNKKIEGINLGDIHCGSENTNVINKTEELLSVLKPNHVVLEDVYDGRAISHHHEKDPFLKYSKSITGEDKLEGELSYLVKFLERFTKYKNVVITRANHDEHLDRYLRERDWKKDTVNSVEYMKLSLAILEGDAPNGVIPYLINHHFPKFKCLGRNDSFMIKGIECSLHGDKGANGARGTATTFKKLNVKTITAHSHTPEIMDGSYIVGTSTKLRLEYNVGLSSWMQGHVIIDNLGKRQQILFYDDNFTTLNDKL